ncbi:MAG: cyclic nucleotide-binding domain-containing protein [Gammaproteobacteria bacterium]|nr:cyclic nucleotide-binding domain-containing protein [Gammaproteobacteria bacterium]
MSLEISASMTDRIDVARVRGFSPFDALKTQNLTDLVAQVELHQARPGQALFNKGDSDKRSIYLLSGTVELTGDDTPRTITGGTNEAYNPIAPGSPRQQTAVALDNVQYFSVNSELLDLTITLDQTGVYEVGDFSSDVGHGEADWMTSLMHTKIFELVPPQCIQMIFMRLQRVDFKAGDVVIQQGSKGDFFYVIRSGRCLVTRETPAGKQNIDLAVLGVGGTFGEEALLSEAARNATVTMQTDGILMRLGRDDFQTLLKEPTLIFLQHEEAAAAAAGGAQWLDVRVPSETRAGGLEGAVNIPLYLLRHKLEALDKDTPYIVICDTGRRSAAAAFILSQHGFQTAVLAGGLNNSATGTA